MALSEEVQLDIRALLREGSKSSPSIARTLGVSTCTVAGIKGHLAREAARVRAINAVEGKHVVPPEERPDPNLDSTGIRDYAMTFEGYDYARLHRFAIGTFANERLDQYLEFGRWTGSFIDLRCCLFFEQRREHWNSQSEGYDYEGATKVFFSLHRALLEAWDREYGPMI